MPTALLQLPVVVNGGFRGDEVSLVGISKTANLRSANTTTNHSKFRKKSLQIRCQSASTEEKKTQRNLLDNASNLLTNLLSGGSLGTMPVAEGAVSDLFGRPLFFSLYDWFLEHGAVYKLAFGPKAFVVVSDPIVARHILRENAFSYDKWLEIVHIMKKHGLGCQGNTGSGTNLCTVKHVNKSVYPVHEAPPLWALGKGRCTQPYRCFMVRLFPNSNPRLQWCKFTVAPRSALYAQLNMWLVKMDATVFNLAHQFRVTSCSPKSSPVWQKGVLADILEPIMGKGLIPADLDTWKQRRRVIAPGFHALFLEAMVKIFTDCSERTISKFEKLLERADTEIVELDLEAEFSSLALDIIGLGVFNYDFGSVTKESPVIKAVYGTLFEAEHRSTFYIPYWKLPLARWVVPRQRKFHNDLKIINECLDGLIRNAKETRQETDVEILQQRDYLNLKDASLLRFLVDMRGADVDDRQLRDDLMTMLIAGHETTAAVLTWAVFLLAKNPSKMKKAQAEIDSVLGQGRTTFDCLKKLEYIRLIVVEVLRLYPQPPLLIRRSLKSDVLPGGYKGDKNGYAIPAGTDIFLSVYNLHRSPFFWDHPHDFEPERFLMPKQSEGIEGWAGFDPDRSLGAMYPNEIISDFAFLPFGGGPRKCVGDQFALLESTVALALLLQKFDVELKGSPESVELVTGATIHTKSGLWCRLRRRRH